jgi:hypothetical protein
MSDSIASVSTHVNLRVKDEWISSASIEIIKERRTIPSGNEHNGRRKSLKNRLTRSLRNDRENHLINWAKAMEKAFVNGNSRLLFSLSRNGTSKSRTVSETIREKDGSLIFNQARRLTRWAEHFKDQFSWPEPIVSSPMDVPQQPVYDISVSAPTEQEVALEIRLLQRNRAPGPDNLSPALFKEGGEPLNRVLCSLLKTIWETEEIPKDWCKSTIIPIYKKGEKSSCDNHRGISLVSIASKVLAGIIRRRLLAPRENQSREEQAGFRPHRGCIDHIFSLRQVMQSRHAYRQPTIVVFLDLKAAFDSVCRKALWGCLLKNGVPLKYVDLLKKLYSNSESRVKVYGKLTPSFTTSSGVRQGCPISPFLFNFVMDDILKTALRESNGSGVDLLPGPKLTDIEYADDIALLGRTTESIQQFLDRLSLAAEGYGMRFAPAKCKILLQDWAGSEPNLSIAGTPLEIVDRFTYLGSIITASSNVSDDINHRIVKARAAFASLRHIWRRRDVRLAVKGRLYNACVRSVLLYGSETWPLRVEDVNKISVFDRRCLRYIARIRWSDRVSNTELLRRVFRNTRNARSVEDLLNLHRLRWLGHVLRMDPNRLPSRTIFAEPAPGWKKPPGGQNTTWLRNMKSLTQPLSKVGRSRLPGWGAREHPTLWLRTLADMAACRSQWRSCIHTICHTTQ